VRQGFDGLEVNLRHPALAGLAAGAVVEQLAAAGLQLVLELFTGGDYVPDLACTPEQHLRELEEQLAQAGSLGTTSSLKATLVSMMGGKSALGKRWVGVCCILVHA